MQTILGAGGVIGRELAAELKKYPGPVRLVSRKPQKINPDDQLLAADLTKPDETLQAVRGSDIVYLLAGLPYDIRVWRTQWPLIMGNVLEACKRYRARLVFFDNVYMYGKVDGWMTENTPFKPCSKKGEVRAAIAGRLIEEYSKKNLEAMIVRSADFYGPGAGTSVFNLLIIDRLKSGKKASWLINDKVKHSFTYTPDAAAATALLGNTPDAYNQTWHLPTDPNALTGKQYIELIAGLLNVKPAYSVLKEWQLQLAGLFNQTVRELKEMGYQNEYEYLFDSTKFDKCFNIKPTGYNEGIKASLGK